MRILHPSNIMLYPTQFGEFFCAHIPFSDPLQGTTGQDHLAIFMDPTMNKPHTNAAVALFQGRQPLVRIHSECLLGDALFSHLCGCGPELTASFKLIAQEGSGLILYLRQEGRGIGLAEKIKALQLMHQSKANDLISMDTFKANVLLGHPADGRKYAFAADILRYFGAYHIRLLGHNPDKKKDLENNGIVIKSLVPLIDRIETAAIAEFIAKLLRGHQFHQQAIETVNDQLKLMLKGSLEIPNSLRLALPEFIQASDTLPFDISSIDGINKLIRLLKLLLSNILRAL
jgi:GTP cyclohydrolase II